MNIYGFKYVWIKWILIFLSIFFTTSGCQEREISHPIASEEQAVNSVDISVTREGIYQVSLSDLGWGIIDTENLQLFHKDTPLPIRVIREADDAFIQFYGEASSSVYTKENVYQLKVSEDTGNQLEEIQSPVPSNTEVQQRVFRTNRIEENVVYSPIAQGGDHWLWSRLIAPSSYEAEFDVQDLAIGDGHLRVALWGNTLAAAAPDHHVIAILNGHKLGDSTWDGQTRHTLEAVIPEGVLHTGTNQLIIEAPGDTGPHLDIIFLDWMEITYPTAASIKGDQQIFTTGKSIIQFQDVLSEAFIFDVTNPTETTLEIITQGKPIFQGQEGHRYLVIPPKGWRQPDSIKPTTLNPDLRRTDNVADYLVIGPEDLLGAIDPIIELRTTQGLLTKKISIEAVYDQFNGGITEPQAIQSFLVYAFENWEAAPRYGLLLGDSSYDFHDYTGSKNQNRLPVMMIETVYGGETGSDVLLAELNGDPWPDIAIGRLPAQTPDQIETYVKKVLRYEEEISSMVDLNVLAIADGQEEIFETDATNFLYFFLEKINTTLLAPNPDDVDAKMEVKNAIENKPWIIAYFGHGSINMWGKDRLFSLEDISELSTSPQLPIILQFTCLTGLFTHPEQESITESLLWHPGGGAIASFAPTSLTLSYTQGHLSSGFVQALFQPDFPRLGDVILSAWRKVPADSPNTRDVLRTFLLFGDPTLSLPSSPP